MKRNTLFRQKTFKGGRIEDLYFMVKYLKNKHPENEHMLSVLESYIKSAFQYEEISHS
ncbi:hypothetical protein [Alicyclobacillus sp. SO9]|uniref:hypothetical protein n=1 Tax=Alicyclobacillus sp. SO9 TaxID=2665646 RepID=UPI0018E75BE1|nr:hypothetical protein [Alicyclobacillus sp. SO9]QQE77557.1 hypothetical protein GI364_16640 [Alicyclobacillus sp. SO9]